MPLPIFELREVAPQEFIDFWCARYVDKNEPLYVNNIGLELNPSHVRALFQLKNGTVLSKEKEDSVSTNFIARLEELKKLDSAIDAQTFLNHFSKGGAVWRIFWLHCFQPNRFPIYDQHVHRAMTYIQSGKQVEIPADDREKIKSYIEEYLPFYSEFNCAEDGSRSLDKALWTFGKFLKTLNVLEHLKGV